MVRGWGSRVVWVLALSFAASACFLDEAEDGATCSVRDLEGGGAELFCSDGTSTTLPTDGERGSDGDPGAPGDRGPAGDRGPEGPPGAGCVIEEGAEAVVVTCGDDSVTLPAGTSCSVEANLDGSATIVCEDGTSADIGRATRPSDEPILELLAGVTSVGSNDGLATETRMDGALHAAFSPDGLFLYFVDSFNGTIRRLGLVSGRVVTLAGQAGVEGVNDGIGAEALFENPRGITIDPSGQTLYIADGFNCTLRTLDTTTFEVRTLFGVPRSCGYVDGDYADARMGLVIGMAMQDDRYVYLGQRANGANAIRRVDLVEERVETIAGGAASAHRDGDGAVAAFAGPGGIDFDETGTWLWVNDTFNQAIRRVHLTETRPTPIDFDAADDLVVDAFAGPVGVDTLGPDSVGELDDNGQPGLQWPWEDASVLGGERDAQFWIGEVDEESDEESGSWEFGVTEDEGLVWATGADAHVNMVLEWDGSGDGSTFAEALPTDALEVNLDDYAGVRLRFARNSAPIEVSFTVGNRDEEASACGEACGFASGASVVGPRVVDGGQESDFEVYLPFHEADAPFADFGIPAADFASVQLLSLRISSAPGVSGNTLALASVSLVRSDDLEDVHTFRVETVAGAPGQAGHVDGPGADARFSVSQGLTRGVDGMYVGGFHNTIRRVDTVPPFTVTTLAGRSGANGSADGHPLEARFGVAFGIHAHPDGERIYFMDRGNNNIREFNTAIGRVRTIMGAPQPTDWRDGAGLDARFRTPSGVLVDHEGRYVYIADQINSVVRRYDLASRVVETLAGQPLVYGFQDGVADSANFDEPVDLALNAAGDTLWVADYDNRAIRALDLETLAVSTVTGGPDRIAQFEAGALVEGTVLEGALDVVVWGRPSGLAFDAERQRLYVSDYSLNRVRVIELATGQVRTLAGGATPPQVPELDDNGDPVVDDNGDPVLVNAEEYEVDGVGDAAILSGPWGLALSSDGQTLYVADRLHHLVRSIDTESGAVTTLAGEYGVPGAFDDVGLDAAFRSPRSVALSSDETRLFVVDASNHALRQLDLASLEVTTVVGELGVSGGLGFQFTPLNIARLYFPGQVTVHAGDLFITARNCLYRVPGLGLDEEAQ